MYHGDESWRSYYPELPKALFGTDRTRKNESMHSGSSELESSLGEPGMDGRSAFCPLTEQAIFVVF